MKKREKNRWKTKKTMNNPRVKKMFGGNDQIGLDLNGYGKKNEEKRKRKWDL